MIIWKIKCAEITGKKRKIDNEAGGGRRGYGGGRGRSALSDEKSSMKI